MNLTYSPKNDDYIAMAIIINCFVLTMLTVAILFYYIRRRYLLSKEIKGISSEKLMCPNFQNHLKNLKTKVMISNFIIIIVFVEFVNSNVRILQDLNFILTHHSHQFINSVSIISHLCHIPLLYLFMKVLWLAYLHSTYKYTIMRWAAYIVLRTILLAFVYLAVLVNPFKCDESIILFFYDLIFVIYEIIDIFTYLLYSRRFYQHLKARELEAKFFKDKNEYLENKFIRIHFKVATILVAIALLVYNISFIIAVGCTVINYVLMTFSLEELKTWYLIQLFVDVFIAGVCQIAFRFLLSLNYIYVMCIILYKYCKQKHNLKRVNDKIRPLVTNYHENIYFRQYC